MTNHVNMYTLTKRSDLKTATWAGGTTTQLAIYPRTAEYQKFNFDFRISYATVEVEESTFTFMPGVTRHLMILKGSLDIDHIDRYAKHLEKFDMDVFDGEWPTKARGKVTDFNLMTRGTAKGEVQALNMNINETKELSLDIDRTGIYLLKGNMQVVFNSENIFLDEGDFILFERESRSSITLEANEDCEVIAAKVNLGQDE